MSLHSSQFRILSFVNHYDNLITFTSLYVVDNYGVVDVAIAVSPSIHTPGSATAVVGVGE